MNKPIIDKDWTNQIDKLIFLFATVYLMISSGWLWVKKQQYDNLASQQTDQVTTSQQTQSSVDSTDNLNNQPSTETTSSNNQPPTTLIKSIPLPQTDENVISSVAEVSNDNSPQVDNTNQSNNQNNLANNLISLSNNQLPPPPENNIVTNQVVAPIKPPSQPIVQPPKLDKIPTFGGNQNPSSTPQITLNNNPSGNTNPPIISTETVTDTEIAITGEEGNVINTNSYSLVGVVQLPENSSFALFENNNLTEKVSVGTEIGTSGWVLMAVNGNQAIVSRNNESRNVRVGESF